MIKEIIKAAKLEKKDGKRTARLAYKSPVVTEKQFVCEPVYFYLVSIEDKPVTKERFLRYDSDLRFTKGAYSIQYVPKNSYRSRKNFPYLIGQDLLRLRVYVSGPRHWGCLCKRIPELGWLHRNSTLKDEYFAIAKKHPGLVIKFGVDFSKYCGTIESRAEAEGIDIDHKPLFTYAWNNSVKEEYKDVPIADYKTKEDYADIILEEENRNKSEED